MAFILGLLVVAPPHRRRRLSPGTAPRAPSTLPSGRGLYSSIRVLIQTLGSAGDLHPFLALARGLVARSHEVVLFGSGYFAALAARERIAAARPVDECRRLVEAVFEGGVR